MKYSNTWATCSSFVDMRCSRRSNEFEMISSWLTILSRFLASSSFWLTAAPPPTPCCCSYLFKSDSGGIKTAFERLVLLSKLPWVAPKPTAGEGLAIFALFNWYLGAPFALAGAAEIYCEATGAYLVFLLDVMPPVNPGDGPTALTPPRSSINSCSYSLRLLFQTMTTESIPAEQK